MENNAPDNIEKMPVELPFFIRLMIKLGIVLVLVVVALIFMNTKCKIKKINVVGSTWYSEQEIISMLQTKKYDSYSLLFKAHYMFSEFPGIAFVEKLKLEMNSLSEVTIKVYEKNIVGCIRIMDDYLYFDKDGIIVASRVERQNDTPLVDGLDFTSASINTKLNVGDDAVFDKILQVTQLIEKYKISVSLIHFDSELAVTLNCNDGNVVYCGARTRYDEVIAALPEILASAEEKGGKYRLDMSSFSSGNTTIRAEFLEKPAEITPEATENTDNPDENTSEDTGNIPQM